MLALALVAAAAGISWWFEGMVRSGAPNTHNSANTAPDYYVDQFTAISMNNDGRPHSRLSATKLVHYAHDDHADLTQPRMLFYPDRGTPWSVIAERARTEEGDRVVNLLGKVHITRAASGANRPLSVDTRDLTVYPDSSYATTNKHAVIRSLSYELSGTGLRGWFEQERLQLLSNVQGIYKHAQP